MARKKKEENLLLTTKENILLDNNIDMEKVKTDLQKYVDEKVNKTFIDELEKTNRKLLREKSKKIFIKNIVIVLLLLIIGFLVYLLYSNDYFDRFFNKNNSEIKENSKVEEKSEDNKEEPKKEETKKEEVKKPTLEELKKEYGNLLENYVISDKCKYLEDFYKGNLTDNLKLYMTLNSFDFNSIKKEDDYQIILNDTFKTAYVKLFDGDYSSTSFDYNGNNIRYVSMMDSYMTASILKKEDSLIQREIQDIKLEDDKVIITTIEGIIKDHKLYNVSNDEEINNYEEDSLLKYSDSLNKVVYTFKNNKLINLGK